MESNTYIEDITMMVKFKYALIAFRTMVAPWWLKCIAYITKL